MRDDVSRINELYRLVLELASAAEPDAVIPEVVELLAEVAAADVAVVEVLSGAATFAHGSAPGVDALRSVARQLVAHAFATREVIALERDEQHVVIAPIGTTRHLGLISLQRRNASGPFVDSESELLRLVATQIGLVVDRRLNLGAMTLTDEIHELEVRRIRDSLLRHHGNVSEVARELRVGRSRVYRVLRRSKPKKR